MNSYFGWDYGGKESAGVSGYRRWYGSGQMSFSYSSKPYKRSRPAEKILLFAEIPYVQVRGLQTPDVMTSADASNDMVLQYANDTDANAKANKAANGVAEAIGFNHKVGNDYSAHISFADGHCEKLMMPRGGNEEMLISLTTWLCTGQEYTFNGNVYEKVSE